MTGTTSPPQGATHALRGSNQKGVRAHNERLVLSMIRRFGPLAKAEVARRTGLSAQTVSVIMRALEADGLLTRNAPVRGRVGQPSVPMRLVERGAFFFGLKVGRRSAELVLIDFVGNILDRASSTYHYPTPDDAVGFARDAVTRMSAGLSAPERKRIAGMGIGIPFRLWHWADHLGVPSAGMDIWKTRDIHLELAGELPFPVFLENDASAACSAELVFGAEDTPQDFLYAYIGYFAGGGLVLNGSLFRGRSGNAGALGSMPVPSAMGDSRQLLQVASLSVLERMLLEVGEDAAGLWEGPDGWQLDPRIKHAWIAGAAKGLAHVAAGAASLLDLRAVLIDGWMPASFRSELVTATAHELRSLDLSGSVPPDICAGSLGADARTMGAASIPLSMRFLVDRNVLMNAGAVR